MTTVMGQGYGMPQALTDILPILLLIMLTAVTLKILHVVISKLTSPIREIPSPPGHFLLGHFLEIFTRDLQEVYEYWLKNFSKNGMLRINLMGWDRIAVSRPEDIKKVLVSEYRKFSRPPHVANALPAMKVGIFGSDREEHAWQRKLLHPSFTSISIKQFADLFIEKSSLLVKLWTRKVNMKKELPCVFVVQNDLRKLLFDIISMAAFGYDINTLSDVSNENVKALGTLISGSFNWRQAALNKFLGFLGFFLRIFGVEDLNKANKMVDTLMSEIIANKDKKLNSSTEKSNQPNSKPDLLELMMKLRDEDTGSVMSEEVLKSNVVTFMVAGYETTSACLTWTLYLLAIHGDKQEKARAEILNAWPRNSDITVEIVESIPYVEYVLKESLRIYPPAAVLGRLTSEPVTLGGFCIPKGYILHVPICYIHKSEDFWTNPLEFKPERFDFDENPIEGNKDIGFQYLPFAMGPRGCIGNKFAMLELRIILASLLKHFKFSISSNHPKVEGKMSLTLQPVPSPEIQVELVSHS